MRLISENQNSHRLIGENQNSHRLIGVTVLWVRMLNSHRFLTKSGENSHQLRESGQFSSIYLHSVCTLQVRAHFEFSKFIEFSGQFLCRNPLFIVNKEAESR